MNRVLSFRNDLIDTIKPFFSQLNNKNNKEKYNINEEKHILFLKSFSNFELEVLHKYKIIDEEIYSNIVPNKTMSTTNSSKKSSALSYNEEKMVKGIIEGDKYYARSRRIIERMKLNDMNGIVWH